ncbi:MAG: hypothetical protein KIS68_01780 [Bauldia sp.]|nr:hypothetical protein [Bauldia sp.]
MHQVIEAARSRAFRFAATIIVAAAAMGGAATHAYAQTAPTALRGVSLGMTRGAIAAALPQNYTLRANNLIFRDAPEQVCGSVNFDRRSVATEFILFRCFFGADAMPYADFAQAVDNGYFAGTFTYTEETVVRIDYPPAMNAMIRKATGASAGGDTIAVIEIVEAAQPVTPDHQVFVQLTVTPPPTGPVFD